MYWIYQYISIFTILCIVCILLYYRYTTKKNMEGFKATHLVASIADLAPKPDPKSGQANAFTSNVFHTKQEYYITRTGSNATDTLLRDIEFCKTAATSNNPFSNPRFASTCGICMTQGTLLLDPTPFSYSTQRLGTGVVVYEADKEASLRESSQAVPSAHSAFCEQLIVDPKISTARLTGLAINAQQYGETKGYLDSLNIVSYYADVKSCPPSVYHPMTCSNANSTISSVRLVYGHFNNSCEATSPLTRTEVFPKDCLGKESCAFNTILPVGQRQWSIEYQCAIQEESIPKGLSPMKRRNISAALRNVPYYWADPFISLTKDIHTFSLYSSYSVSKDTQIKIEYSTNASFDMYLHSLKQYSQPSPGRSFVHQSNSPVFTLYKGANVIRLNVTTTNPTGNGLYLRIKDVDGTVLSTLDSTWVYSTRESFINPLTRVFPVATKPLWSNAPIKASIIAPKNPTTTKINYFKQVTLSSEKILTLATCIFDSSITKPLDNSFTYSVYLTFDGREKQILMSKDNTDRVKAYSEYFPAGTTTLRVSVEGNGNTCLIALLNDSTKREIAVSDRSWTCDEPPVTAAAATATATAAYTVQDFVTYTALGTDLPNQPMIGTVQQCQNVCSANPSCLGFSRLKGVKPTSSSSCHLKKNMTTRSTNQGYETYVKKK